MDWMVEFLEQLLTPFVFWGTVAVGVVVVVTIVLGSVATLIIEFLPDVVREFKRWVRVQWGLLLEHAPIWRSQFSAKVRRLRRA